MTSTNLPVAWKAILNWRANAGVAAALLVLPLAAASATLVTPSGPAVPENLLRIVVHLDAPLSAPLDMQHVQLLDGAGVPIKDAFLDLPLAGRDGKSLTLLLHPGRIKTGVGPNVALGPALHAGQSVMLRIDDPQLGRGVEKRWQVLPPLRQPITPQQWTLAALKRGSREPMRVMLPAALDGDAAPLLALQGPDGRRVEGVARLAPGESEWRFAPARAWRAGKYVLRVHSQLEDPQGNRLCAAFEQAQQSAQQCDDEGRREFIID
ncbi:hypothetical protein GTP45_06535 [Pseudoduganella sp. FT55W]|uniref:Uncharacterized protein n=1 Tax=Duganella rivi TaxID=2666083 RepID=A0A7X4GN14_9BURK|nr:hypothetical protein [Duganella rivi]MYM66493.1 hypothetical protein [Duganella rivi]